MTRKQRLELRASEIRTALAKLADVEELTDEQRAEIGKLRTEYADVETRIQAATVAGDEPTREPAGEDGEARELRELRGRVEFRNYVGAAVEKRGVEGAELEFNQALNIGAHRFPLEILAPAPVETRATTDTDAGPTRPRRWLDRLFADTAAMRVGVTMESVEPGIASFPATTAGASATQRGRTEAAADAAWTIGVTELKPTRNAVRAVFSREDELRNPGLQDALQRDLRMALVEGVDRTVFIGDDGANENAADITGLTTASITEVEITQANKVKADKTLETFTGMVDGVYAGGLGDLRVVAAVGAWRLWENTIHNSAAENETVAQFLRRAGLSWTSRGEIETATANGDFGAFVGLGRGIEGAAVCPIWSDGQLIVDPYTGAAKGEVALTLSYFWNFGIVRAANFRRIKFVT